MACLVPEADHLPAPDTVPARGRESQQYQHTGIHELFGTLEDVDRLLAEIHARAMPRILDFVPSHTSNAHPCLIKSRASRANPKRS